MDEAKRARLEKRSVYSAKGEQGDGAGDARRLKRKRALKKKQIRRRLLIVGLTLLLVALLAFSCAGIIKQKKEQHDVKEKQEQLKEEKEQMEQDLGEIYDLYTIENQAREKLKFVKPGEVIYIPDETE